MSLNCFFEIITTFEILLYFSSGTRGHKAETQRYNLNETTPTCLATRTWHA